MNHTIFALKGTIAYTPVPDKFVFAEDSFLVCENERVKGIWKELPDELKGIRVCDYTGKIISRECVICTCMHLSTRFGDSG